MLYQIALVLVGLGTSCEGFLSVPTRLHVSHSFKIVSTKVSPSQLFLQQTTNVQTPERAALQGETLEPFTLASQDGAKWKEFFIAVGGVLGSLAYVWLVPGGPQLGDQFVHAIEGLAGGDSTLAITYMLLIFAVIHSGLASLRPLAEPIVGAKAWRYIFAYPSLALGFTSIVYFINHRYDGTQLWDLRLAPGMHDLVWWSSLVSFLFLYPSTFNLLEVAVNTLDTRHSSMMLLISYLIAFISAYMRAISPFYPTFIYPYAIIHYLEH